MAQKQRQIQEQRQTVSFAEQAAASFLTGNMENGREIQIRHLSKAYGSHVVVRALRDPLVPQSGQLDRLAPSAPLDQWLRFFRVIREDNVRSKGADTGDDIRIQRTAPASPCRLCF